MPVDMRNLVDSYGRPHGLVNSLPNSVGKKEDFSQFKEKDRESMKKMYKDSKKMIDVRYVNSRGDELNKTFAQWAGDNLDTYRFLNNHIYTVPQGLVDEMQSKHTNPGLAQRSEILDVNGVPTKKDGENVREHVFYPASF